MIVLPDFTQVTCAGDFCLRYTYLLFLIIPLILYILMTIGKTKVKFANKLQQKEYVEGKRQKRRVIGWMRVLAIIFIVCALASPFKLTDKTIPGNPRLTILVDNSSSMSAFDGSVAQTLFDSLETTIPVNIRTIASGDSSALGNGILNHLDPSEPMLVVTDGQNTNGKLLGDVLLFASSINATISTVNLEVQEQDASVWIEGPSEIIKDNAGDFTVHVDTVGDMPYRVKLMLDDTTTLLDESTSGSQSFSINRIISEPGSHTMTAELEVEDFSSVNNKFFKSVKVVPRPKILYVSPTRSPLLNELERLYVVDHRSTIPSDLSEYLAILLDNLHAGAILPHMDALTTHIEEGNGLLVIGGENAYESGGYKGTLLESLLPVKMGAGEESDQSNVNIVLLIDISAASAEEIPYEKALALSVLDSLDPTNNVGVVAFNSKAYEVVPIKPLEEHTDEIRDKISKLSFDGQSLFYLGLQGAYDQLQDTGGSKNIILLSDGYTTYNKLRDDTEEVARNLFARGVKTFTVGVGNSQDPLFLGNIATLGGGIYFKTDAENKLSVLFGESDPNEGPEYFNSLVVLDSGHFITRELDLSATISGYNYVVPKPQARLLLTTSKNIPLLTVWRFGLGRVATLSTDNGLKWGGELLNQRNSKVMTRTINWVIGDLSRKKTFDVSIADGSVGDPALITVISDTLPSEEGKLFAKIDTNVYTATHDQSEPGLFTVLGATGAINYPKEYQRLGVSSEFTSLVNSTGGQIFDPQDTENILSFVKSHSKRIKITSEDYRWPLLIVALVLFLTDICIRRIWENKEQER